MKASQRIQYSIYTKRTDLRDVRYVCKRHKAQHTNFIFAFPPSASMVAIYVAYTAQINPAGVTPVLTRAQVWKGLQRKVRRAQDFVTVINDCTVLEDKGSVVVREAKFAAGPDSVPGREGKTIREVCKLYEPVKVYCA